MNQHENNCIGNHGFYNCGAKPCLVEREYGPRFAPHSLDVVAQEAEQNDALATALQLPASWQGLTKSEIANRATVAAIAAADTGNALVVAEALSAMEAFVKAMKEQPAFADAVQHELGAYAGKFNAPSGALIEACEVGTKYDYSHDSIHKALKDHADKAAAELKQHEEYLKRIPAGKEILDPETGEVLGVGPAKSSKTSFKVTLAK